MRKITILLLVLLYQITSARGCVVENMNREWRFCLGDYIGAETVMFDDGKWETVGLPHSFSIPYFMSKDFYTGYGWYRKNVIIDKIKNECFFLVFEGVFQEAEVFVNGKKAGAHRGGYTAFEVDITPYVHKGSNVIAVRVNNLWQPTLAPRAGEHVFSGGIYRNVWLLRKSAIAHIRWQGIHVTTPTLAENNGKASKVQVRVDVENRSANNPLVEVDIVDDGGKIVGHNDDIIENPKLWSPNTPYLYKVVVRLFNGQKLLDEETVSFGFRWFRWSKDDGFFLNGKHLFFRGANVHQDQAGWGDAVTDESARRDVRMIKEAGFTMIRGSHYPHSQAFIDECDRQGLLFWSEAPFWGTAGPKDDGAWTASAYPVNPADTAAFEQSALQQLEEMVLQHRNHPSVFVWSMCNEPFFTSEGTMPGVRRLLKRMVERTHQLDPTRPAAIGGAQRPLGNNNRIDIIGDIAGYNGDGANIPDFQNPPIPSVVSEYGSTTADRPGKYFAGWGDLEREDGWRGRQWRSGQAIWCGFDHGSIFGEEMGKMGIVDYFRLPKRSWYWYRSEYSHIDPPDERREGIPASVCLSASKTTSIRADGTDDVQLIASIVDEEGRGLANSPVVTFRILDGPGELPTGRSISFSDNSDIRIQDGLCAITLRSYYSGITLVEASSEGLHSDTLCLTFNGAPKYKPGVSHQTGNRPYVRYSKAEHQHQTYGTNNPTFSSSSAEGLSPGLAADGNIQTYWQPASTDEEPSWTLDTERSLMMHEINVSFITPVSAVVEVSQNQETWTKVQEIKSQIQAVIHFNTSCKARFLRLLFPSGSTPQLSEVLIKGYIE